MIGCKLILKKNYEMIMIAKRFETYVFPRNNHVPEERKLKLPKEAIKFIFFCKKQSCSQREGAFYPPKTLLVLGAI